MLKARKEKKANCLQAAGGANMETGVVGTVIVGLILVGIVTLAIRSIIKDKKNGKSVQCGCDCSQCKGCH